MDSQTKGFIAAVVSAAVVIVTLIVSMTYYHATVDRYALENGYEESILLPGSGTTGWVKKQPATEKDKAWEQTK